MAVDRRPLLLIQFARAPVAGRVKTRLLGVLSPEEARDLHSELVLRTCDTLVRAGLGPVRLYVAGGRNHTLFRRCLALGAESLVPQRGADLGERMLHATGDALRRFTRVILVGSDCPAIDGAYLQRAVEALSRVPVVLGPARDGGYVLLGLDRPCAELFGNMPWGTGEVLSVTRERLLGCGHHWEELEALPDIDRPEDLVHWRSRRSGEGRTPVGERS